MLGFFLHSLINEPTVEKEKEKLVEVDKKKKGGNKRDYIFSTMPTVIINTLTLNAWTSERSKAFSHEPEAKTKNPTEVCSGLWVVLVLCQRNATIRR